MSITVITEERNIANALISGLANMTETPTREQVEEKARPSPWKSLQGRRGGWTELRQWKDASL